MSIATKNSKKPKHNTLQHEGVLNPNPEKVVDSIFNGSTFFDPEDLIQVKYEMLRKVDIEKMTISEASSNFGFSRPSFYEAKNSFKAGGLIGLIPLKRGPRRNHKLGGDILKYINKKIDSTPNIRSIELVNALHEKYGLSVHPRSIERALNRQKKNQNRDK